MTPNPTPARLRLRTLLALTTALTLSSIAALTAPAATLGAIFQWMQRNLKYDERAAYAWRTLDEMLQQRTYGGCADHAVVFGWATHEELAEIRRQALAVNEVLKKFMAERGVLLVDFKLEFGRTPDGSVLLADEICPDTCRFWDAKTRERLDKDRFRQDLGNVEEAYREIMKRVAG